MNLTEISQIDCLMGCKQTLASCQARQMRRWRYSNPRDKSTLNVMFISCKSCKYWLTDEEYQKRTPDITKHAFGVRGQIARKNRREQNLIPTRSETLRSGHANDSEPDIRYGHKKGHKGIFIGLL